MDKHEYRKRLEELAVIKDKKPAKSPQHNRLAKEIVIEIDEETGEEIEVEREIKENPTLGFDLVKIKDRVESCNLGCGDIVTNQVIERRLCETPIKHWRTRCATCGCYVSPDGIGFIEGGHMVSAAYMRYFKGLPIKHPKAIPEGAIGHRDGQEYVEDTTNDSIIRVFK